jgi:hypothetical protein
MKAIELKTKVNGKELLFQMDACGLWSLGPTGLEAYDGSVSGVIKNPEDRVALGRFLVEVGSKLATPKKVKP